MTGVYSCNSPRRLFNRLARSYVAFHNSPSEDGIFDVVFPLYHLREWICPGGPASYKGKPNDKLSLEERLHSQLHSTAEYQIVRDLCNNAKHYNDASNLANRTDVLEGLRVGIGRAGDSLGITHFLVDGKEIRDVFSPVYKMYVDYFEEAECA